MAQGKTGVARLAAHTGAAVVPVAIKANRRCVASLQKSAPEAMEKILLQIWRTYVF